jgi:hypothetical protein
LHANPECWQDSQPVPEAKRQLVTLGLQAKKKRQAGHRELGECEGMFPELRDRDRQ